MIHYGWVIAIAWAAGAVGFVAGCCWVGVCRANDRADKIIDDEYHQDNCI